MSFRQAVIQLGSSTIKAGLWEQTFLPTVVMASAVTAHADGTASFGLDAEGLSSQARAGAIFPIAHGEIVDEERFEELLLHVLLDRLGLGSSPAQLADVRLLLVISPDFSRTTRSDIQRILLKHVAVLYFGEAPLMAAFACACPTALVIQVGHNSTKVSAVVHGAIPSSACHVVLPIGGKDVPGEEACKREPPLAGCSGEATSPAPHSPPACNPFRALFFGAPASTHADASGAPPHGAILDAIRIVLAACDQEHRVTLMDHVVLTGGASRSALLRAALEEGLAAVLAISEYPGEHQPRSFAIRSVPEYYPEIWREATPLAVWFGAGITAKCVLNEGGGRSRLIS